MMTKQVSKVPSLRFPEFDGEWEEKRLGDISSNVMYGMNSSAMSFDGTNKYIRITDIDEESRAFRPNPLTSPDGKLEEKYKLKDGDIVFARTGASVGKSYMYQESDGVLYFAGFLIRFSITSSNTKFVFQQTLRSPYEKWVLVMSMRSGQPGINAEEYKLLRLHIPEQPEQQKIADFLTAVDKRIEHLEEKKRLLTEYKKGVMQQIFSQQIRFTDDAGNPYPDWQEKRLGDMCNITTGKLDANAKVEGGQYRFYTCAKDYFRIDKYHFDTEALLISGNGANVGYIHYYKGKFNAYQRTYVLDAFSETIIFIKYILEKDLRQRIYAEKKEGNTPYIVLGTLSDMALLMPSDKGEQQKIADFLTSIDNKIEQVGAQLEQAKAFKKGLLQQMFV